MLAFANMMHFLANEFSSLCAGGFTLTAVATRALERFSFGHDDTFGIVASVDGLPSDGKRTWQNHWNWAAGSLLI
jgi:hypothetical protein